MYKREDSLRAALAEQVARQILHGCSPAALYPLLRRRTTAELLEQGQRSSACSRALALPAALDTLLCAVQLAVRRRPGWLHVEGLREIPPGFVIGVPAMLLQAALLCFFRDCLRCGSVASISCRVVRGAVLLRLCGSLGCGNEETSALLSALVSTCGGVAVFNAVSGFTAVLRLPASPTPFRASVCSPTAEDLLNDRFSPLYLYLHKLCADPWQ